MVERQRNAVSGHHLLQEPEVALGILLLSKQGMKHLGDGSSEELTGAAAAGMLPILKRADLNDVYHRHRPEVESWRGPAVDEIGELLDVLSELEK